VVDGQATHLAALAAGMSTSKAAEVASAEATFQQKFWEFLFQEIPEGHWMGHFFGGGIKRCKLGKSLESSLIPQQPLRIWLVCLM